MQTIPRHFRTARRGLTFIELMFSTIILGVGMIIIAAAFPVAISEQRATLDEATVASLERGAIRTLDAAVQQMNSTTTPNPWLQVTPSQTQSVTRIEGTPPGPVIKSQLLGTVESMDYKNPAGWNRVAGDLVCTANERYAWTPLYMRPDPNPAAPLTTPQPKVTFFVTSLVSRDSATFLGDNLDPADQIKELNKLKPTAVTITYHFKEDAPADPAFLVDPEQDTIKIEMAAGSSKPIETRAAVEGGFIIRGQYVNTDSVLFPQNAIIKLGTQFDPAELTAAAQSEALSKGARWFRVAPGFELLSDDVKMKDATSPYTPNLPAAVTGVRAWAVGRYVDVNNEPVNEADLKAGRANRALSCRGITLDIQPPG